MKRSYRIFVFALGAAAVVWVADAVIGRYVWSQRGFWQLLVADVPACALIRRFVVLAGLMAVAGAAALCARGQRRSTEALRESERTLATLLGNLPGMAYRCANDPQWTMEFVSQGCRALTGYPPEDLQNNALIAYEDLILPEDRQEVRRAVDEAVAERRAFRLHYRIRTAAGQVKWVWEQGCGIFEGEGEAPVLEGFIIDETQRHRAEDEAQSIARFPSENPFPVIRLDAEGRVLYANAPGAAVLEDWGCSVGERVPDPWRQRVAEALGAGEANRVDFEHRRRILSIEIVPMSDTGYVNLYGRDITERVRAQQELRKERDRIQHYLDVASVILLALDTQGRVVLINRRGCELLGRSESEILGANWFENFVPSDVRLSMRPVFDDLVTGRKDPGEYFENPVLTADGGQRIIAWNNALVHDDQGRIIGTLSSGADITERRETQEHLRRAQKLEAIGRLAGGIAHDFNNQLTVVRGYCDLLLREMDESNRCHQGLSEIRRAADRAARLTSQLLTYSRRQVLHPAVIDLNRVVEAIADPLARMVGEDVRLIVRAQPNLWQVQADPMQCQQVIMNLASNARDAMPDGGTLTIETANVELDARQAKQMPGAKVGPHVVLSATDTGIGMDAVTREQIFEPFFTTKPVGEGTGLGLATVYGFVRQSGGHIHVRSAPGEGTMLTIYLPRVESAAEAEAPADAAAGLPTGSERVLVVEDEAAVGAFVARTLSQCGYTVLSASDGDEAVKQAQACSEDIDLLITDVVMPGMNGRELAATLIAARPSLRVLYMSGYSPDTFDQRSGAAIDAMLLVKPFGSRELATTVRRVLDEPV